MFQQYDQVYIKDSAQLDIGALAWNYIKSHREAQIIDVQCDATKVGAPENESLYTVVWSEPFEGGWDCWHHCLTGYGQIVTQKNMELQFEASRPLCATMPNIQERQDNHEIYR